MKRLWILLIVLSCVSCKIFEASVAHEPSDTTVDITAAKPPATTRAPEDNPVVQNTVLVWNAPAGVLDINHYVVAISNLADDLRVAGTPLITEQSDCVLPECQHALNPMLSGLADGPYMTWVRTVDHHGNESVWSDPLEILTDQTTPPPPTGLRITVEVTVTVVTE